MELGYTFLTQSSPWLRIELRYAIVLGTLLGTRLVVRDKQSSRTVFRTLLSSAFLSRKVDFRNLGVTSLTRVTLYTQCDVFLNYNVSNEKVTLVFGLRGDVFLNYTTRVISVSGSTPPRFPHRGVGPAPGPFTEK